MVKISAVQMEIDKNSLDENVEKMIVYMNEAKGSDIICFPETSLTDLIKPTYAEVERRINRISEKSRDLNMWAIFGGYAKRENNVFNEVYILNRKGNLVYTYRKRHLWNEKGVTPGNSNNPIDTDFGKIGVITCWDIAFPDDIIELTQAGPKIIFCPSYWYDKPSKDKPDYFGYPNARAHENQVFFVMCDAHPNKDNNYETLGRTKILSPVSVLAETSSAELITTDVDLSLLDSLRQKFNCWKR